MKSKNFKFDKFIKDIEKREDDFRKKALEHQSGQAELGTRRYNKLYREHWQNRIKMERKNVKN
tara:strand:+ start:4901 stop:5089 length:189 start_codon:yes stop_codon:yes gene_type:complete